MNHLESMYKKFESLMRKDIAELKDKKRKDLQFRTVYEAGIIKYLSPQGSKLFAVVQRLPEEVPNEDGSISKIDGLYFGNEDGLDKKDVFLADLLIVTDVNLEVSKVDIESLIGNLVTVKSVGLTAVLVKITTALTEARNIPKSEIKSARSRSKTKGVFDNLSIEYLIAKGYNEDTINAIIGETLYSTPRGAIIGYGRPEWGQKAGLSNSRIDNIALVEKQGVSHLPAEEEETSIFCFKASKALSAK
ncbi:hypothetical protein N9242_00950 [Vicingaceae bacterium]|nr:hypothetical protein [Vicingaceae bacterium]